MENDYLTPITSSYTLLNIIILIIFYLLNFENYFNILYFVYIFIKDNFF